MSFIRIPNHVQAALARLLTEYQNSPKFKGLMTALLGPIQDIENALMGMNEDRYLSGAVGVQLDNIGEIVGISRPPGMSDDEYRQILYGKIKENISQGQPEQAIQVFQLFTQSGLVILSEDIAGIVLESAWVPPDQATVDRIITIIQNTIPAGTRVDGIVSFDPLIPFAYDGSLPGAGYDDGSQTVGGKYAKVFEYVGGGFAYDGNDPTGLGYGSLFDPLVGGTYLT